MNLSYIILTNETHILITEHFDLPRKFLHVPFTIKAHQFPTLRGNDSF